MLVHQPSYHARVQLLRPVAGIKEYGRKAEAFCFDQTTVTYIQIRYMSQLQTKKKQNP